MRIQNTFRKPYFFWFIGILVVYLFLTVLFSKFYVTAQYIPYFLDTLNWTNLLLSFVFTVVLAILVSINIISSYIRYQEIKKQKEEEKKKKQTDKKNVATTVTTTTLTTAGTIGGLATGVCTACVASIFPAFFGLFGVTLSFAALPFQGLEVQLGLILLLIGNIYYLQKRGGE